ncbi:MAG: hypothetical protein Q4D95_01080, partial [Peptoniphilus sp.]|nr:hypothetical protein [Peptoniphilus sp.]
MLKIRRNRKHRKKNRTKLFVTLFFILLLVLSYKMLSGRNKIMHLELKNVSYVELIRFDVNYMTSINDSAKLRDIL